MKSQAAQAHNRTAQRKNVRIGSGIYREFDKIAKMYMNSHLKAL